MVRIGDGANAAPAGQVSTLDVQPQAQTLAQPGPAVDVKPDVFQAQPQQGIVAGGCYYPQPFPLPFPLPEPQPLPLPHPLPPFPPFPQPRDASVAAATAKLDQQPGPISGEDMAKAIKEGTQDLDNSSAGREYRQFSDWATKNQDKLSPEAQEVMKVYTKYANTAQAQGQTGMPQATFDKMCAEMNKVGATDVSAQKAIDGLSKGDGKISGEDMTRAIEQGTKDLDAHSAGAEHDQFAKFAKQNPDRLSPEAKQVMDIYNKYASAAKANGQTGINPADYQKMLGEMKNVKTYKDESMGNALDQLNHTKGPVSGQQMLDAIKNGSQDTDGQAAGTELQDVLGWARDNAGRLSPDAKKMVAIYVKYATQAVLKGQTGMDQADYQKMLAEMKQALAPPPRFVAA